MSYRKMKMKRRIKNDNKNDIKYVNNNFRNS